MKKKICKHCKESYKKKAKVVTLFGSTFCLHDDRLENYERMKHLPMKSEPEMRSEVAVWGHNKAEQNYIDKAHRRGNAVVRGSDKILREVTTKKTRK